MPSGTGLDLFAEGISRPHVRRRHRRAACGDLRRRAWRPKATSRSPRSIRPSCSAPTTRSCTTSRSSRCRCASPSTAPASSAPTAPTHAGSFDVAYLGCLPGFVVMAAADEAELVHMVATAAAIDDRPSAFRYPRGEGIGVADAGRRRAARDRQGPHPARRHQGRAALFRRAARRMPRRPPTSSPASASRPPSPMRASPSRSTPIWCCGSRASTKC